LTELDEIEAGVLLGGHRRRTEMRARHQIDRKLDPMLLAS
jgi:hypothetical protein